MAALGGAKKARMSAPEILQLDDNWTAFSFVRNPWGRLVSAFTQKAGENPTSRRIVDGIYQGFDQGIPIRANMSFEEFCEVVCDIPDSKTDKHLCSQSSFLIYKKTPSFLSLARLSEWPRTGLDYCSKQVLMANYPISIEPKKKVCITVTFTRMRQL